jgi:hypothetical protein
MTVRPWLRWPDLAVLATINGNGSGEIAVARAISTGLGSAL